MIRGIRRATLGGTVNGQVCDSTCLPVVHEAVGQEPVAHNFFLGYVYVRFGL